MVPGGIGAPAWKVACLLFALGCLLASGLSASSYPPARREAPSHRLPTSPSDSAPVKTRPVALPVKVPAPIEFVDLSRNGASEFLVASLMGSIWHIHPKRGELLLDLSKRVLREGEAGLLGMAVHPNFSNPSAPGHGDFFVFYAVRTAKGGAIRLSRFSRRESSEKTERTERVLIEQLHPKSYGGYYHLGGQVRFGPDGYLYFSVGDGGNQGSDATTQTLRHKLLSGIFRIDPDCRPGNFPPRARPRDATTQGYCIPRDNPFTSAPGDLAEYFALGLRNPFRFSFDSATGEMWAGDVGGDRVEEINRIKKGGNYQWKYREGHLSHGKRPAVVPGEETPPFFSYGHSATRGSVIGGFVYRGSALRLWKKKQRGTGGPGYRRAP